MQFRPESRRLIAEDQLGCVSSGPLRTIRRVVRENGAPDREDLIGVIRERRRVLACVVVCQRRAAPIPADGLFHHAESNGREVVIRRFAERLDVIRSSHVPRRLGTENGIRQPELMLHQRGLAEGVGRSAG